MRASLFGSLSRVLGKNGRNALRSFPMAIRVLLIDNDDSFTWNLAHQIGSLGVDCDVRSHRELSVPVILALKPDRIVLSAGPGHPKDASLCNDLLQYVRTSAESVHIPILGVCLGHQCIAYVFGGPSFVTHAPVVRHGKTSAIFHKGDSILHGLPSPFPAARYHSLLVQTLPEHVELLCWTGSQKKPELIMGMRHATLPIVGVQFHPESFLTGGGDRLMKNFLFG